MHPSDVTRALAKLAVICVLAFATLLAPSVAAYAEPVTCGSLTISHRDGLALKEGTDFTYASNVLTIKTLRPVVVGMSDQGDGASPDRIVVDPGETSTAHVTLSDVNIDEKPGNASDATPNDNEDMLPGATTDEKLDNAGAVNGGKPSEGPSTVGQGTSEHERVPSTGDFSPSASAVLLAGFAVVLIAALSRRCRS